MCFGPNDNCVHLLVKTADMVPKIFTTVTDYVTDIPKGNSGMEV